MTPLNNKWHLIHATLIKQYDEDFAKIVKYISYHHNYRIDTSVTSLVNTYRYSTRIEWCDCFGKIYTINHEENTQLDEEQVIVIVVGRLNRWRMRRRYRKVIK